MITVTILAMAMTAAPDDQPNDTQTKLLKTFRDEFVEITPGKGDFPKSFEMGRNDGPKDEGPAHKVTFNYSFEIAKYEVPQNLWEAVMGSNPSRWKGPRNSVEWLTFDEAQAFCESATELMRAAKLIKPNEAIRLPSEAEWEYVARAGTDTAYSFGNDKAELTDFAWYAGNAAGNDPPVGVKKPNPWSLYDLHGYLWEWCADAAHENYQGAPADGSAWTTGGDATARVIRGGSWKDKAELLTSFCRTGSFRHIAKPGAKQEIISFEGGVRKDLRDDALGLRCVLAEVSMFRK